MENRKKWIFDAALLLAVTGLTFYALLHGENLRQLWQIFIMADDRFWLAAFGCVAVFVSSESLILFLLLNKLGEKVHPGHCLLYSAIGFFFSGITPASGGGQPAQVLYMRRDGLNPGTTAPVLILVTICYKMVLVIAGLALCIVWPVAMILVDKGIIWWAFAGWIANIAVVAFFLLLIIRPHLVENACLSLLSRVEHFRLLQSRAAQWKKNAMHSFTQYRDVAGCIRSNKRLVALVLLISIVQRTALFSVTWLVMRSFHIMNTVPAADIILLQSMVSLGTDMLPLPGGTGANESMFYLLFDSLCGEELVIPTLIASRGISHYGQIVLCGIVFILFRHVIGKNKEKRIQ